MWCALPKPTCVTEQSPGWWQVCWCTGLTSVLSCLSRQGSKRADSSGPHDGSSLAAWPPACTLAPVTFPSSLVRIRKRWRILFSRCKQISRWENFKKFPMAFLSLHAPFWFTLICHWGTIKEITNVRFELLYVKMFSKHNSVVSCNAPLFYLLERRVWFFSGFPFSLSYYHACIISRQPQLSVSSLLWVMSSFPSLSSTLCSCCTFYYNSLIQMTLILMANKITFISCQSSPDATRCAQHVLLWEAPLYLTPMIQRNVLSNSRVSAGS